MPVRKSPKKDETIAAKFIEEGGSVAASNQKEKEKKLSVQLRIPKDLLDRIDAQVEQRPVKIPRHLWLLEAIHEKLEKEKM
jgi:hypothetical protein